MLPCAEAMLKWPTLFDRYGLSQLAQNEKRARLVAAVLDSGVLAPRDF